jgi:hypothetical protein
VKKKKEKPMMTRRSLFKFFGFGIFLIFFSFWKSVQQWRYIMILQPDGLWKRSEFKDIKKGDWFVMFDPNGKPTHSYGDGVIYKCRSSKDAWPYGNKGNWAVELTEMTAI